ncbi:hypothetical protein L5515_018999 [Caenorhabditis briggsae]|uniref:Uncharacterized protein n=1 Tax=Caenorhabditis briggsae TaxID=6238 RepID=A0AAE9FKZ7_CAEBR|nr:hypothetical protein L5515_018999 [Caenorhabditis briggsae]
MEGYGIGGDKGKASVYGLVFSFTKPLSSTGHQKTISDVYPEFADARKARICVQDKGYPPRMEKMNELSQSTIKTKTDYCALDANTRSQETFVFGVTKSLSSTGLQKTSAMSPELVDTRKTEICVQG